MLADSPSPGSLSPRGHLIEIQIGFTSPIIFSFISVISLPAMATSWNDFSFCVILLILERAG